MKPQAPGRRPDARASLAFLLWWFGIILVFFSIPRAKLGSYILPALAPLAIVAGYALCRLPRLEVSSLRRLFGTLALLNLAATAAIAIARAYFASQAESALLADALAATAALTAASLACLAIAWRGSNVTAAVGALALGVVVALGVMGKARMDAQPLGSYRELARAIVPYLAPGCRLASYRHFVQSLPFYTGYREALVDYRGELAPFGLGPDARESFIATDAGLAQLWHGAGMRRAGGQSKRSPARPRAAWAPRQRSSDARAKSSRSTTGRSPNRPGRACARRIFIREAGDLVSRRANCKFLLL